MSLLLTLVLHGVLYERGSHPLLHVVRSPVSDNTYGSLTSKQIFTQPNQASPYGRLYGPWITLGALEGRRLASSLRSSCTLEKLKLSHW
jgi:hypothetical protein